MHTAQGGTSQGLAENIRQEEMGSFHLSGKPGAERHQPPSTLGFGEAALLKGVGMANMRTPQATPQRTFFSLKFLFLQKHTLYLQTPTAVDALHAYIPNTVIPKPAVT